MRALFALFFLVSALSAQSLPTGLYQVIREDGRPFLVEAGWKIRKALFIDGAATNVLKISANKDKSFSFRTAGGEELFSSADTPMKKLSRPRYSFAPIPAEGAMLHRGFVVSGRAFRNLDGVKILKINLDTLRPKYALLETKGAFWTESYFDERKIPPLFLGRIAYKALPIDGIHWAVLSSVNYSGTEEQSQLAVFSKQGSKLKRTALLAEGMGGFGGLLDIAVEGKTLSYWRSMDVVPPSWPGLYAEALSIALQVSSGGSSLMGRFLYNIGARAELEQIHLAHDIEIQGRVFAKKGAAFKSPQEFQKFLRTLMPEALRRKENLTHKNAPN